MCDRDYFEFVPPSSRGRNDADYALVCPAEEEKARKAIENEAEVARLRRDNDRLLAVLERASNMWTVKDRKPR